MSELIRVLIADDHLVVRQGLLGFLETYADIQVVAGAENGVQAVALAREHVPDVILMDILSCLPVQMELQMVTGNLKLDFFFCFITSA